MWIWTEWQKHKQLYDGSIIPAVDELDPATLANLLTHFALEVHKKNGDEFHTILFITSSVEYDDTYSYISMEIQLLTSSTIQLVLINLDAEMKRLQKKSFESTKRQTEPLLIEELLWSKGLLGQGIHRHWWWMQCST